MILHKILELDKYNVLYISNIVFGNFQTLVISQVSTYACARASLEKF